jgi:hypothetical protein
MIRDEAEKLSTRLQERLAEGACGAAVTAAVEADSKRIEFAAPGGGRPTVIRYHITLTGGDRVARLGLDQAEALLSDLDPRWDPDRLFEEVRSRGMPVEASGDPGG